MLLRIVTCCKNCQILIHSPLKVKSLHLLSKFRGCIFNGREILPVDLKKKKIVGS